ncbi:MAG TPA: RNA-binding S4 domain-containing protein [Rubrivivax sp.]|nr:RNA-binding S4 domain-containing protein [Rubrivivax sp.]
MTHIDFELRGEFIPLDALLKATGLADSGGRAKALVAAGQVQVDGHTELRKTCKLRAGQQVRFADAHIRIVAASSQRPAPGG